MGVLMRSPVRIESEDGTLSYTFPRYAYEWGSSQEFRTSYGEGIGTSFAYDYLGRTTAPRGVGKDQVRFLIYAGSPAATESEMQTLRSILGRLGRGKLWVQSSANEMWWAWVRLESMPEIIYGTGRGPIHPISLSFVRLCDWREEDQVTGTVNLTSASQSFTITNPGDAFVFDAVFRFRSNGATGFDTPTLKNMINGWQFSSARVASGADDELKVDCAQSKVLWSTDDGSTYASDFVNLTISDKQGGFMRLNVGDNEMLYTDGATPDAVLEYSFWAPHY